jgi:ABC-type maltose transport system permease subunit
MRVPLRSGIDHRTPLIAYAFLQRYIASGLTAGAVKG